jgi:mRNA interferase MazF
MDKEHKKDFKAWNIKKSQIDESSYKDIYFYERDVWWIALGHNVGFEQDGKSEIFTRPVLIIRKFNKYLFWGVPLTSVNKTGKYYAQAQYRGDVKSVAILSQLRAFDAKRLVDKDGVLDKESFKNIQHKLLDIIKNKSLK